MISIVVTILVAVGFYILGMFSPFRPHKERKKIEKPGSMFNAPH
jgi:hypothetical protein